MKPRLKWHGKHQLAAGFQHAPAVPQPGDGEFEIDGEKIVVSAIGNAGTSGKIGLIGFPEKFESLCHCFMRLRILVFENFRITRFYR